MLVGAAKAMAAVVSYIVIEGKIDSETVTLASKFVQKVIAAIETAKEQGYSDGGNNEYDGNIRTTPDTTN